MKKPLYFSLLAKHTLVGVIFLSISETGATQNLNVTLANNLAYGGQTLANVWGWKDTADGKEYALIGAENGLSIVDVTNPASVFQVVQITGPSCLWREVKTVGNYAYVTSECGSSGLQIIDLSPLPSAFLPTAAWTPTINGQTLQTIHALHADGGKVYLYGSNVGNRGCIVADVTTDPMAPAYLGKYDPRYVHDGYVRNDTLYAAHIYDGECAIVNLSDPNTPTLLATFSTPTQFTHNTWLSQDSKTVFTTDENNNSFLAAFDISNLNNVTELDRIQSNPGSNSVVHNTHIINVGGNDYAVTSWYNDGFTIVDAGRPNNLVQVGNYDTAPTSSGSGMGHDWGVYPFFPSGTIVASDESNGLFVCSPTYIRASYLEGVVTDCITGNPLSGTLVQIVNSPAYSVNSSSDITDPAGKYGVGLVTAGVYTVTISKQAYISQTFTVSISSGNVTALNVQLCSQTPPFNYAGNVFDNPTSNGIDSAMVHIQDSSLIWDIITDANGNFAIPNMLGGTYDILVGKWGYITQCFSAVNLNVASVPLAVGLNTGIYDDFSFDFGWTVSGSCSNSWERDVPIGTYDNSNGGVTANPDLDVQNDCSDKCYITDNGGGGVWDHDVDPPGTTILISPVFDLTVYDQPVLVYSRWFYNHGFLNGNPNDTMTIQLSNGIATVLLEQILNSTIDTSNGHWVHREFKISSFITPTAMMQLIITTADASPGNIVEGGFDTFFVYDSAAAAVNNIVSLDEQVRVYPNPSNGRFTIYGLPFTKGNYELEIYSLLGENVWKLTIDNKQKSVNFIVPGGMYFYKIISGEKATYTGKLLIE